MGDENGSAKLRTLDDLSAAMQEAAGGKCDRCRRDAATLRFGAQIRRPKGGQRAGLAKPEASVSVLVCEPCGVDLFAAIGRAVGRVAA